MEAQPRLVSPLGVKLYGTVAVVVLGALTLLLVLENSTTVITLSKSFIPDGGGDVQSAVCPPFSAMIVFPYRTLMLALCLLPAHVQRSEVHSVAREFL